MKEFKNFAWITFSIFVMAVGVYFFKFPNNFCFGGVTGFAVVVAKLTPLSASMFSFWANNILLVIGFVFLGKQFAIKTGYASLLLSGLLMLFERLFPLTQPLSNQPVLELIFAIALPSVGSAILFNIGASSGGTDVLAMLLKKYTNMENIGLALLITDMLAIFIACFVFDIKTALFSFVGLIFKSFMIDGVIESINQHKAVTVICTNPEPICRFITEELNRDATICAAEGAFTHAEKSMIVSVMDRAQAVRLRQYIHATDPKAFVLINNTSQVIGKGFVTV